MDEYSIHDTIPSQIFPKRRLVRAGIACQECSRRRVRCDVEISLIPCTNCKLDCTDCVFDNKSRRTKTRRLKIRNVLSRSRGKEHKTTHQNDQLISPTSSGEIPYDIHQNPRSSLRENECAEGSHSTPSSPAKSDTCQKSFQWTLPHYILDPPAHLDAADFAYLQAKEALEIPDQHLERALLRAYVKYVHDFLPIIDLHHFLEALLSDRGQFNKKNRVSLFVYQAVMFASVTSVPLPFLQRAGFQSRKNTREFFESKVKVCHRIV